MKYEISFGFCGGQTIIINQDAVHDKWHCQVTVQFCDMVWYWGYAFIVNNDFVGDMIGICLNGHDANGDHYDTNVEKGLCLSSALRNCGYDIAAQQVRELAAHIIVAGGFPM